tara:strand:+ start:122 stop:1159 length:1038 start_codon:yes stop_codon:yes gene_type:complete
MKNKNAWHLTDLDKVPKNNIKVMTTFSCGGGSSMGYKLAGCDVIAANDIDSKMKEHYLENFKVKHYIQAPIIDLLNQELPEELYNLDILDGSPPCSTFSMIGNREEDWGKERYFTEGQSKQVLSDLFFDFIKLVDRLKPKVAIAENVKGMILGNAKGYTKLVMEEFRNIGYEPQLFLVNGKNCGVPQARERVFFCCIRKDLFKKKLELNINEQIVSVKTATDDIQELTEEEQQFAYNVPDSTKKLYHLVKPGKNFATVKNDGREFSKFRLNANKPSPTICASSYGQVMHWNDCRKITVREYVRIGTFPDDYKFRSNRFAVYLIGMSVPPKMMYQVAKNVCEQWLK